MTMTKDEIVRDYKAAKTPAKQIAVLADLNVCTKKEIVEILREAGCELPAYYNKKKQETPEQAKEQKPEKSLGEKIEGIQDALLALKPAPAEKPLAEKLGYTGAQENLSALTKAKVAFSDAIRAMLPESDSDEDFEDIDKELFFERVIGMVVMLDALERREKRA